MNEPTFHELEYLNLTRYLKEIVDSEEKVSSKDDYDLGVSAGKEELAKELLMFMYEKIISWNY